MRLTAPLMTMSLLLSCVAYADTSLTERVAVAIAADRAAGALAAFAAQARINVIFRGERIDAVPTNALRGTFTRFDALMRILAGTSLAFVMVNERTIAVWSSSEFPCGPSGSSDLIESSPTHGSASAAVKAVLRHDDPPVEQVDVNALRTARDSLKPQPSLEKLTVSRDRIEQSGAVTLPDALRSLTQAFGGNVTEGTIYNGREADSNGNHATGINIRGLGAASTLIMVNGHRTVRGGTDAMYTETDMFPIEGLRGLELLLDGPPLQFGGDSIGGIINIVTNRQFIGSSTEVQSNGLVGDARREYRLGHIQGWKWGDTHLELSFELRQQSALAGNSRHQYTSDLTRLGGSDFRSPFSQPGTLLAGGQMYAIPDGQNGASPSKTSFVPNTQNLADQWAGTDLEPRQRRWNAYLEFDHEFADGLIGSTESLCGRRRVTDNAGAYTTALAVDSSSPYYVNPSGGTDPVVVLYKFNKELGSTVQHARVTTCDSTLSLEARDLSGWRINSFLSYGTQRQTEVTDGLIDFPSLAAALTGTYGPPFNPSGDGSKTDPDVIEAFRSSSHFSSRSDQWDLFLAVDRALLSLLSREVRLGVGAEYRKETLDSKLRDSKSSPEITSNLARSISSAFAELTLPIPGHASFTASGRYDHYSDFGSVLSPEYALTVAPSQSISVRASWAKLFRPPNISQLLETHNVTEISTLPDTRSASGVTTVLLESGRNSQLKEERSRNWSIRVDFKPQTLVGLRASVSYFHIHAQGLIEETPYQADLLDNPEFKSIVNRNPTLSQLQALCSSGHFEGSADSCLSTPISAIVDLRTRNAAILTTSGFDLDAAQAWPLSYRQPRWGELEASLNGTYVFDYSQAATPDSPKIQLRETPNNPVDLRLRPMLQWKLPGLVTMLAINYSNHYRDNISIPNRYIASWTTVDVQVSYKVDRLNRSALDGTEVLLTATNLLDRDPPFVNNRLHGVGYDVVNGNLAGRVVGITLRKQW